MPPITGGIIIKKNREGHREKREREREREIKGKRLVKNTLKWSYIACVMPIASGIPLNYANICLMVLPLASIVLNYLSL